MMKFLAFSFVLFFAIGICFCQNYVIPEVDGFRAEGNMIYGFELCQRNNTSIPMPDTPKSTELLTAFLEDKKVYKAWIGANDMGEEGRFRWLTGGRRVASTSFNWHIAQPDNSNNEDCVEFNKYEGKWAWNDLQCEEKLIIVCEAK